MINGQPCTIVSAQNITYLLSSALPAGSALTFTIDSVLNPPSVLTTSSFAIYTYYDSGYDSLVDSVNHSITVDITPKTMQEATITPASLTANSLTSYELNLTLNNPIPAFGSIAIKFPPSVTPSDLTSIASSTFNTDSCTLAYVSASNTI
jgi:hypothetical protein